MKPKSAISFQNVSKRFVLQGDKTLKEIIPSLIKGNGLGHVYTALDGISFDILEGETVGIIGKNGAGKSTIMKLIAGVTYPTKGKVNVHGKVSPLIELGAGFHHELTGLENIYLNAAILGMHKKEIAEKVEAIIEFSGLADFMDLPVKRYSTGMYMRLAFSIAIQSTANILLLDEILAVGDEEFQDKCLDYLENLKEQKDKTIIFISHDEKAVKSFCSRSILIDHGKLLDDGPTKEVFKRYHHILHKPE